MPQIRLKISLNPSSYPQAQVVTVMFSAASRGAGSDVILSLALIFDSLSVLSIIFSTSCSICTSSARRCHLPLVFCLRCAVPVFVIINHFYSLENCPSSCAARLVAFLCCSGQPCLLHKLQSTLLKARAVSSSCPEPYQALKKKVNEASR